MARPQRWDFWIDRGGTFTDVVARDPRGRIHVRKLLSDDPEHYDDAPLEAMRRLLGVPAGEPLPPDRIGSIRMGTTVATNALLTRTGAAVCLAVTRGFADLLEIGYQDRPDIFALRIVKPAPIVSERIEIDERALADGTVRRAPDPEAVRAALAAVLARGVRSLAVVLLHSYAHPAHEQLIGRIAREVGFDHVALSHAVSGEIKAVARGGTTAVDAYLTPILRAYVARLRAAIGPSGDGRRGRRRRVDLRFMQSHGGLAEAERFAGAGAILSGPAGGVVACGHVARLAGLERVIGFDMGGTSTDVSRYDGRYERVFEGRAAGVPIQTPMMNIHTVAAGGGSVLSFADGRMQVGPSSAGADPGPSCYRRGGPATVTDANAVLGRIQPRHFPACFGPNADEPLDADAARAAVGELAGRVSAETHPAMSMEAAAAGFVRIANENMVKAIREISLARGADVREYALVCFGGAAAQHACAVAERLGVRTVLLHPLAGVLSAYGMGLADTIATHVEAVLRPLDESSVTGLAPRFAAAEAAAGREMAEQGLGPARITHLRSLDLRYEGVEAYLNVPLEVGADPREAFEARHRRRFGFVKPGHPVEVVNLRLETRGETVKPDEPARPAPAHEVDPGSAVDAAVVHFEMAAGDGSRDLQAVHTPIYRRSDLRPGGHLRGPAIVVEDVSTVVVDPGWAARVNGRGHLLLTVERAPRRRERVGRTSDPVLLEVFGNLFMSVAEQMGITLRKVSHSTNIKERLDFSCAVFDGGGALVANAPHIPVHLGAMGESVRSIVASAGEAMRPGDVYATNDPYRGGSHLPDLTVVTPVFAGSGERVFFVGSRGHHADIGGVAPGSMPPDSRSIDEEGVLIRDFLLVSGGRLRERELVELLSSGRYPARNVPERLSDVRAAIAANAAGVRLLGELIERYGLDVVAAYMRHVNDNAEQAMRAVLAELPDGEHHFEDFLDDGSRIAVAVRVAGDRAVVDFAGTGGQLPGNLNAPRAVVTAAVLYVFRTLIPRPIPLNAGCLAPVEIRVPRGSLLDPLPPAAVAGGNVETSMRIVDVLYGALGKLAAGQGTMNNLTFGDERTAYYETVCGGAGAGLGFDGAHAVHTGMTNTRSTDPEVIERRYPVLLRSFAVRRGSGGPGVWRGGDGSKREIEFLAPMSAGILSERRARPPFGLHGGGPGRCGRNVLVRRGGREEPLGGKARCDVAAGDVLVVATPGGGGYNPSPGEWAAMAPAAARRLFREGRWDGPTAGISAGYVQANLVALPAAAADAFEAWCRANPGPCPLLERLPAGSALTRGLADAADLRTDLPRYHLLRAKSEDLAATDARPWWREDLTAFLLGCSFSFDAALMRAGLPCRHVEQGVNVPMYRTTRPTQAVDPFAGPLVVTMRPMPPGRVDDAAEVTGACGAAHGPPVHHGDPSVLGIADPARPDYGDPVEVRPGEVPVFWACGVTSRPAVRQALDAGAIDLAIVHAPGHMFISDRPLAEFRRRQ